MSEITIPVTIGFDSSKVIGSMTIDSDKLPKDYDFVFSLGVKVEKPTSNGYELCMVGTVDDEVYYKYLSSLEVDGE